MKPLNRITENLFQVTVIAIILLTGAKIVLHVIQNPELFSF